MPRILTFIAHPGLRYAFAAIWLVNGLFCKVLGLVPRHERIVAVILGEEHAGSFTVAIGISEVVMAAWILSGWRYQQCAAAQIAVIVGMNIIEFAAVPHLLLWGRFNALFAVMLAVLIYANAFGPKKPL
jgi:hypothetical protein